MGALDPAGNFTAAASRQITVDNTAPTAPTPTSPQEQTVTSPSATVAWANPAGQVAPVSVAHIAFCGPSGCSTHTQPASGASGSATLTLLGPGVYSVGVAVADAAGNFDPTQVAGWSIAYPATSAAPAPAPTTPAPVPTPNPPAGAQAPAPAPLPRPRATPALKVAQPSVARDRRTITVRGTVARGVTGRVTITARARIRGRTRTVTRRAGIRSGRYAARVRLPSSAWRSATVSVRFAGNARHRPAGVTRHARQRAH